MTDSRTARAAILGDIREALRGEPARALPEPAPVFPPEVPPGRAVLARMFASELAALSGETLFVESPAGLPGALSRLLTERRYKTAAVQNSPRVGAALAQMSGDRFFLAEGASKDHIEAADCGIIEAEALLADTGSVIGIFKSRGERMVPYLPRTCIVIADAAQLHHHMDAAALFALYGAARAGLCGEGVIITGPSRSADIEKVLVLGAHGPQALIVLMTGLTSS